MLRCIDCIACEQEACAVEALGVFRLSASKAGTLLKLRTIIQQSQRSCVMCNKNNVD